MATNPSYEAAPAAKRRKRRSRWETAEPSPAAPTGSGTVANMQLALPPGIAKLISANSGGSPQDALAQLQLNRRLDEVNARIASNDFADRRPVAERSPSPPPEYDASGVRTNTREERIKQSLVNERQDIIGKLMQTGSGFTPPSDYKQTKLMKKLYVPTREYPGYNFIGLIIGPRGNTQKRMERETGAKIALRGKGSVKEGRTNQNALQGRVDPTENEDLHVVVTCDNEEGLNRAVAMVEQLLVPVDEAANQHKRMQLRELAELNGTLRSEEFWQRKRDEQDATDIYKLPEHMKAKVDEQYQKDVAKFTGEDPAKMNQEYQNFLDEIGGRTNEKPGSNPNPVPSHLAGGRAGGSGGGRGVGYQGRQKGDREIDESNLYVGYLPRDLREPDLHSLFETYGHVVEARIISDRNTGEPRGFGFVRFSSAEAAKAAIENLDGFLVMDRRICVRVAGQKSLPRGTIPRNVPPPFHAGGGPPPRQGFPQQHHNFPPPHGPMFQPPPPPPPGIESGPPPPPPPGPPGLMGPGFDQYYPQQMGMPPQGIGMWPQSGYMVPPPPPPEQDPPPPPPPEDPAPPPPPPPAENAQEDEYAAFMKEVS